MRTQIFLERNGLDLYDDVSAEFTYAIDDVKDFASRNTSFSKTIVVPGTANNNKLFGHIFEFTSSNPYDPNQKNVGTNYNAAVAANCVILVDNIQIFKGVLRLIQINMDRGAIEYECVVFGELGGFANEIANKKIDQLDFSEFDHAWTVENITGSWDSIDGSGYFYPLIDYGKVSTNKHDWQFKALRPAIYVKEYVHRIITGAGYTYDSNFFETNLFKRLVIPTNVRELRQRSVIALQATGKSQTYSNSNDVLWDVSILGDFLYNTTTGLFTYNNAAPFTTDISLTLSGTVVNISPLFPTIQLQVYKNATLIASEIKTISSTPESYVFSQIINNITFNQNDTFKVRIVINSDEWNVNGGVLSMRSLNPEQLIAVNYGDEIEMNAHIPRGIFQRDFITSIVKMFNLYITEDAQQSRHLIIEPGAYYYQRGEDTLFAVNDFGELLELGLGDYLLIEPGESAFIDWTYKIDRSKPMTLKPMSELNGRYFEYKYKPDNDFYNEQYQKKYEQGYADRLVDTGFAFANDKQTAEIIFSATPLVGYTGETKVYPTVVKLTNVGTPTQIEDGTDHNIRILQVHKFENIPSWQILDGVTVKATIDSWGYGGHLDNPLEPSNDINFGSPRELYFTIPSGGEYPSANLFTGFWGDYVAEITDKDSKLLTCFVRLTETDVYDLNFSRLIFIDGALWRLNKVIDFNTEDVTKCEFLRVIELTYE